MRNLILILVIVLFNAITFYGQGYYGYYKRQFDISGLGGIQRIHLDTNSTFEYAYAFDLFYDKANGTYSIKNDTIFLNYITEFAHDWQIIDSINREYVLGNVKFSKKDYDTTTYRITIPSTSIRPGILLYRKNKLIILKYPLNQEFNPNKKIKFNRVKAEDWNDRGACFLQFE